MAREGEIMKPINRGDTPHRNRPQSGRISPEHRIPAGGAWTLFMRLYLSCRRPPRQEKKSRMDAPYDNRKDLLDKAFKSKNGSEIQQLILVITLLIHHKVRLTCPCARISPFGFLTAMRKQWMQRSVSRACIAKNGTPNTMWDGRTYGEATIQKALDGCTAFFGNCHSQKTVPGATESSDGMAATAATSR